jgi:hypothetical protein
MPLIGSWDVVCKNGHVDRVDGITNNHECESGDDDDCVSDGAARVRCPHCGTVDLVGGVTQQHNCSNCGQEVRL